MISDAVVFGGISEIMSNTKSVLLLRHGRTRANIEKRYIGSRTDLSLSAEGIAEIKEKAEQIRSLAGFDQTGINDIYIASSPMKRAVETAMVLFPEIDIYRDLNLAEIDFGDFEGKNYEELKDEPAYQKWIDSEGTSCFPNGEKREDFIRRSNAGFTEVLKNSGDCENVGIICHGGNIMAVMSTLTGREYYDFMTKNLEGYLLRFNLENERITDLSYNRINAGHHS